MRLMTNNPAKYGGLASYNLEIVERIPLVSIPNHENRRYPLTKAEKLGHFLPFDDGPGPGKPGMTPPLLGGQARPV
jgi:3,4-dihydroxy 2-butanone 4-phosphate synthase/GTP cyclohydrolase II